MGFGKRKPGAWAARRTVRPSAAPRRRLVTTAVLGLLIGLCATSAATGVRASEGGLLHGLFQTIFGGGSAAPAPVASPAPKAPRRYASLPDTRRPAGHRLVQRTPRLDARPVRSGRRERAVTPVSFASAAVVAGTRTVCVRRCDGYVFPLGRLHARADLPVHAAACAAACPSAPTDLFTLAPGRSELEHAVGLDGRPYLRIASANLYRRTRVENCSCQPPGIAGPSMPLVDDRTLRAGDVIASEEGADLVAGLSRAGPRLVDYRAAALSPRGRGLIEERVGAMRRDAASAAFQEVLRAQRSGARRLRVAEAQNMKLRIDMAATDFAPVVASGGGFTQIRVVTPSPFGR
ncbi:hypothetical protein MPPM_3197 [Methylorubrum populi]|uniref:DUF2865 domain-containing protein n=1 Tax=Methylorubrum populi TaxID=223967 RepID=A0A169R6J4_9HYPH|nr:DUF2865 domain-containing protein [Methylorubrum populi]BAU91802.1 hypothetical protein MPPM_3197 [Methylorubrum populi]